MSAITYLLIFPFINTIYLRSISNSLKSGVKNYLYINFLYLIIFYGGMKTD